MPITTTVIGSYPYGRIEPQEAIRRAVQDQLNAGIDIITDGQVRSDMVGIFVEKTPGYEVKQKKFRLIGKVGIPSEGINTEDFKFVRSIAGGHRIKVCLTGPTTLAACSLLEEGAPYSSVMDERLIMDLADMLAEEARRLTECGCEIIQIDEPMFSTGVALDVSIAAIKKIIPHIKFPCMHTCGDTRSILKRLIEEVPVKVIAAEGAFALDVPELTGEFLQAHGKTFCMGCIDTKKNVVETVDEIKERIEKGIEKVGIENLWVSPDCGMRARKHEAAKEKLENLVKAAKEVSQKYGY
jgi:5-methyltetrahydropteroyltriglutamate--homocysteine methyltransferase